MIDHFRVLAPIYDRMIPVVDPEIYRSLLDLPAQGSMLDVGGGTGRVSAPLQQWVKHLVVADVSRAMLRRAQKRGGMWPVRSMAERLPFADGVFDRVLAADALHHFRSQLVAVKELIRVLSHGGRMVVEEPDITRPLIRLLALMEKLAMMKSRFLSAEIIAEMAKGPGITSKIVRDGKWLSWVIIFKEKTR